MDESNLGLCLIRSEEHGTKIVRVQVRHIIHNIHNKIYSPTHRTPGPPVEVGVVRDHGGRHGAPDLNIGVGEDVAAPQPPASAP